MLGAFAIALLPTDTPATKTRRDAGEPILADN
jgi:hypothetical protein